MLSVLMPAYNEEATIHRVIERVRATGLVGEIVIVDDGSTDGTRAILAEYANDHDIKVVLHEQNAVWGIGRRHHCHHQES